MADLVASSSSDSNSYESRSKSRPLSRSLRHRSDDAITPTPTLTPTPSDPQAYLALSKFSRRIICSRTKMPVSFADFGYEGGEPLLWMMPSGGSRWFAAAHDPLCRRYGIRMIVVDRPGIGATPVVPLSSRIEVTGKLVASVLDHLQVRPAHILAASAGIYYALHLLIHHPEVLSTGLRPPPTLYFISPWSPLLPPDHPDHCPSYFTWIPTILISTQHHTVPTLMKAGKGAVNLWDTGQKAWSSAKTWLSQTAQPANNGGPRPNLNPTQTSFLSSAFVTAPARLSSLSGSAAQPHPSTSASISEKASSGAIKPDAVVDAPPVPVSEEEKSQRTASEAEATLGKQQGEEPNVNAQNGSSGRMWGRCPCCISCLVTEYFQAENFEGVGQDHLLCLNRGSDTGHEWFERTLSDLENCLLSHAPSINPGPENNPTRKPSGDKDDAPISNGEATSKNKKKKLKMHIWWGWQDGMVPRPGQLWLNKTIAAQAPSIDLRIHDVPDGDHNDLLARQEGIYQVYEMIRIAASRERF